MYRPIRFIGEQMMTNRTILHKYKKYKKQSLKSTLADLESIAGVPRQSLPEKSPPVDYFDTDSPPGGVLLSMRVRL